MMRQGRIDVAVMRRVQAVLRGRRLPLDRDPAASIVGVDLDSTDFRRLRIDWVLHGDHRSIEVLVTEGAFEPDAESIASQICWEIVEAVETGEIS